MNDIFLLLGTNVGNRVNNLSDAVQKLVDAGLKITRRSAIYESEPWGDKDQSWFLNLVLQAGTTTSAHQLLKSILKIETDLGRKRERKWGPRIIDIDILYYNKVQINEDHLAVPHPGIPDRKFTLMPLVELEPDFIHPILQKSHTQLLEGTTDHSECFKTHYNLTNEFI